MSPPSGNTEEQVGNKRVRTKGKSGSFIGNSFWIEDGCPQDLSVRL